MKHKLAISHLYFSFITSVITHKNTKKFLGSTKFQINLQNLNINFSQKPVFNFQIFALKNCVHIFSIQI